MNSEVVRVIAVILVLGSATLALAAGVCGPQPPDIPGGHWVCIYGEGWDWQADPPPPPGTSCDDKDPCTYNDMYDAYGTCHGTSITCSSGGGCTQRTCNGTSVCTETPMTHGEPCEDGNPCTYA